MVNGEDFVQPLERGRIKLERGRAVDAVEVAERAHADDGRGDRGLVQHPGCGDDALGFAQLTAELRELRELFVLPDADAVFFLDRVGARAGLGLRLACQQPAGQRHVGNHADAELARGGQDFKLRIAAEQVIHRLLGDDAEVPALLCDALVLRQPPTGEVAGADVEHVAPAGEPLERRPELLARDAAVDVMHLVQVDVVGLEPAQ